MSPEPLAIDRIRLATHCCGLGRPSDGSVPAAAGRTAVGTIVDGTRL